MTVMIINYVVIIILIQYNEHEYIKYVKLNHSPN